MRRWIEPEHPELSIARQCALVGLPRSTWYYRPAGESAENLALMRSIDEQYLRTPFYGSRKLAELLGVNRKRVQRLMRRMGIEAIYPKRRTTWPAAGHQIYPYLLRNVEVLRPDQVWASDITYVPLRHGFLYLVPRGHPISTGQDLASVASNDRFGGLLSHGCPSDCLSALRAGLSALPTGQFWVLYACSLSGRREVARR